MLVRIESTILDGRHLPGDRCKMASSMASAKRKQVTRCVVPENEEVCVANVRVSFGVTTYGSFTRVHNI